MAFHYLSTLCRLGNDSIKNQVILKLYAVICSVRRSYNIRQALKGNKNHKTGVFVFPYICQTPKKPFLSRTDPVTELWGTILQTCTFVFHRKSKAVWNNTSYAMTSHRKTLRLQPFVQCFSFKMMCDVKLARIFTFFTVLIYTFLCFSLL